MVSLGDLPEGYPHGDANPNEEVGLHCVSTEDHQMRTEGPLIPMNPDPYLVSHQMQCTTPRITCTWVGSLSGKLFVHSSLSSSNTSM